VSKRRSWPRRRPQTNLKTLERDLHRNQPNRGELIHQIVVKHARLQTNGRPVTCRPSQWDIYRDDPLDLHSWGKVIFDDEDAARACATELRTVLHDETPSYTYECRRSQLGHVHLTSRRPLSNAR
jgi:hypothetical protein